MAELAGFAVGRAPAGVNLPMPIQRPYAADPGTLTEWLVSHTDRVGRDEMLEVLAAMNAKYANVVDATKTPEEVTTLLKELAEDVLASEGLESFLTVTTPEGGKPTIITVSRLSRFRSGIGQVSQFDNDVYGFFGEVEEGQLPPLMKLPDALSMRQALAVREVRVASVEEWIAWYGEGADNPRVPIQGDELMAEEALGNMVTVKVPLLQYVPMAWAPYFMAAQTPEAAMRTLRKLEDGNLSERQDMITASLKFWLKAACMRSGAIGVHRYRSKLHLTWATPRGALDRTLSRWATRRLAPFMSIAAIVPPTIAAPPLPGGGPMAGVPFGAPPHGATGMLPYEARETKVYSPLEHERIRLACGLDLANYEAGRPAIYAVILAEGRSMVKVEAVLQKFMAPAPDDWDPIRLYISQELVRDMKDLKFGWGNENTYDTCHRGISPFAVLQVSMEQQTKRRKTQERADRATYLSTDDVRSLETEPGFCPSSYYGMLNLLRRYIRLLTVLFGGGCAHLTEVQGVYQVLAEKAAVYESMSGELVAETLWQVFVDARDCFSHLGPGLPESQLFTLRHYIRSCSLKVTINCPVNLLLNVQPGPAPGVVSQTSSNATRNGRAAHHGGGSMGSSTLSTLSTPTMQENATRVGGKRTNPQPVPEIVAIMQGLRTHTPGVTMNEFMRSEKLLMADVGIGGRGACLDFMYFGECARPGCTYNHDPQSVSAGKRRDIVKKMNRAVKTFIEKNPGE